MTSIFDRFVAWAARLVATALLVAGVSMLVAGVPLIGMATGFPIASTIARFLLELSALFIVAGATVIYLSRRRGLLFPNESIAGGERPEIGGWLIVLAIVLVALPVFLTLQLQPFLAEWARVASFLETLDIWRGANANGSGLVLLPLAAALTPPFFELAAMIGFVIASAILLLLLLSRSDSFPRLYVVCLVLLAALVVASVRGAGAVMIAGDAVQQLIDDSSATAEESTQLNDGLARYTSIVSSTAPILVWTLMGYLVWLPPVMFSARARTTFARRVAGHASTSAVGADIETITSPPRFPG